MRLRFWLPGLWLGLVLSGSGRVQAQTSLTSSTPWGTWLIGTVQVSGSSRWGGFGEVQSRANAFGRQFFYYELKGGLSYSLDKNFTLTLAGGRYGTYQPQHLTDGPLNTEARLWEQLVLNQYLARLRFEHRYRVEQRWFTLRDGTPSYRNRIRYRLNLFVPLNRRSIGPGTTFVSAYDEIFLNPRGPIFERNRLYAGLGYQADAHWVVQLGWVNQTNYSPAQFAQGVFTPGTSAGKNNVVLNLTYRLLSRRSKTLPPTERLPSQPD